MDKRSFQVRYTEILFVIAILLSSGCATTLQREQSQDPPDSIPQQKKAEEFEQDQGKRASKTGVVDKIIRMAEKLILGGQHEKAVMELENAARISPKRADIYLRLGQIRYEQKRCPQASGMAKKAKQLGLRNALNIQRADTIILKCHTKSSRW
ncbi:MAG: tetratricopeptide repeat protein [Nitrospinota bacterium]